MEDAIAVRNLMKSFGTVVAVDDLSFAVPEGVIAGFVGPNGAGKSTTMRILATLEHQDSGTAKIFGMDVRLSPNLRGVRRSIGFMPDYFGLYDDMAAGDFLNFFAAAYRIPPDKRGKLIDDILAIVDLTGKKDALIHGLSRGMQQKLSLGRCLVHDPRVLILDEPASGLDPRARIELLECLKELRSLGKTILISSHILSELESLCDMLIIIESGELAYSGTLDEAARSLTDGGGQYCVLAVSGDPDCAAAILEDLDDVTAVRRADSALYVAYAEPMSVADIICACVSAGVRIEEAKRGRADLKQVFMELTRGT